MKDIEESQEMSVTIVSPIVDIVPKYVAITPNRSLTRIQPAGGCSRDLSPNSSCGYASSDNCSPVKPRKRRLDHLTWEEKIQRKKLKNRVAAQTSRDRKKARMEEMENEIKELTEKTEILQNKCDSLMTINDSLLEKNRKLDLEVNSLRQELLDIQTQQKCNKQAIEKIISCENCASMAPNGSAVSKDTIPLQQELLKLETSDKQQQQQQQQIAVLWKIVALCLLYKTCSSSMTSRMSAKKTSMPAVWKNWQKLYSPISQQTWKLAIERAMKMLPKSQAAQSDCLNQWWGPQQNAWNPADIQQQQQEIAA